MRLMKSGLEFGMIFFIVTGGALASPFDGVPTPRVPGFGGFVPVLDWLTNVQLSLNASLGDGLLGFAQGFNLGVFLSTLAVAIAYGAVHALSPGHGKSPLLVQGLRGGRLSIRSLFAPCLGAFLHVSSALLWTTMFTILAERAFRLGRAELSVALLVFSSIILLLNGLKDLFPVSAHHHHAHAKDAEAHGYGWLPVALGIGLVPCPVSTLVFSAALANGIAFYGVLVCLIFALGLAITMTVFALAPIVARNTLGRFLESATGRIVVRVLPISSSVFFVILGVMGIVQAIQIA